MKSAPKQTPEALAAITEIASRVFAGHGSLRDAARLSGVSHETLRQWLKRGRAGEDGFVAFSTACDKALTVAKLRAWKKTEERDPKWVLVVRHKVKDSPTKLEHSGPGGKPIPVAAGLTDATLDLIRREALGVKVKKEAGT